MSKEAEARVRDELLQQLYSAVLRAHLTQERDGTGDRGGKRGSARGGVALALCAGVCANLQPADLLLLPGRGADSFRALRGSYTGGSDVSSADALRPGSLTMPRDEAAAVAFALGTAHAHAHAAAETLVCVLMPATPGEPASGRRRSGHDTLPQKWEAVGDYAARHALPLLLVSDQPSSPRAAAGDKPAHLRPAPLYPSIPVDRDDALAIYRVAFECSVRARAGLGPSRIQCVPFRLRGEHEPQEQKQPGALGRLEGMLRRRGAFPKAWRRQLERGLIRDLSS